MPYPRHDHLVVMTACIDPSKGTFRITRKDPALRIADYKRALSFWLNYPDPTIGAILLIDNSGHPLDELRAHAEANNPLGKQVEMLSFDANDYPEHLDYGYAELKMLDLGLPASKLAAERPYWMKVTGRLTFPGTSRLLRRLPDEFPFAVNLRRHYPIFARKKELWVHTRQFIVHRDFYMQHMLDVKSQMVHGQVIERMLYHFFMKFKDEPNAVLRYPVHVPPHGISGYSGQSYQSWKRQASDVVRHVAHAVTPWWWI